MWKYLIISFFWFAHRCAHTRTRQSRVTSFKSNASVSVDKEINFRKRLFHSSSVFHPSSYAHLPDPSKSRLVFFFSQNSSTIFRLYAPCLWTYNDFKVLSLLRLAAHLSVFSFKWVLIFYFIGNLFFGQFSPNSFVEFDRILVVWQSLVHRHILKTMLRECDDAVLRTCFNLIWNYV